jgi:hypothetical protein
MQGFAPPSVSENELIFEVDVLLFQTSLMFSSKAGANPSGAPLY